MPSSYAYHLKFELYPTPNPAAVFEDDDDFYADGTAEQLAPTASLWRPGPGASIFDDLPRQAEGSDGGSGSGRGGDTITLPIREPIDGPTIGKVIDCGTANEGILENSDGDERDGEHHEYNENNNNSRRRPRRNTGKRVIRSDSGNLLWLTDQQWQQHEQASAWATPVPGFTSGLGPVTAVRDWRFGRVRIASFDMEDDDETKAADGGRQPSEQAQQTEQEDGAAAGGGGGGGGEEEQRRTPAASLGPVLGGAGQATRARYHPLATKTTDAGWGIVHLYREGGPTYVNDGDEGEGNGNGSDGTVLCVPAVPSYLTPSDFLGFVGETWSRDVSHYRMVMTSRTNRYMVLLKFRDAARARAWREAFDGRVFNSMESEICHVAFIKSITIETSPTLGQSRSRPTVPRKTTMTAEHTSAPAGAAGPSNTTASSSSHVSNSLRPFPPPTPNLIELPTCPVCLERMDDTAGLMTILCQHVFHCTCLQTWKGSGCPVCRATNPSPMASAGSGAPPGAEGAGASADYDPNNPYTRPFGAGVSNLCSVCDCPDDLWICLICGNVGCGRYKGGHAKEHWKETAHSFSLELETQHVWDYAGDMWVHRLIRDKGDGKVVELPGRGGEGWGENNSNTRNNTTNANASGANNRAGTGPDEDVVPRAKLERIGMEYTHLLTSQLESQRVYFEEMVSKAADKAAKAHAAAEAASLQTTQALRELQALRAEHETLSKQTVPALERDVERERRRADKASELARGLGKSLQEEKKVSEGLMTRIGHVQGQVSALQEQLAAAQAESADLRETNRDLTMFISGQEKLRELEAEGQVAAGEVEAGTASVPEETKGKGKGRRKR